MPALRRIADQPTWLLNRANARAQATLLTALARTGVRGYHVRVLAALEQEGPSSQAELGRATGVDRSDIVATVNDLVAWELVTRQPDPADQRRNVVSVTDLGRSRLEDLDAVLAAVQDEVLAPLDRNERTTLLRLLRKLG